MGKNERWRPPNTSSQEFVMPNRRTLGASLLLTALTVLPSAGVYAQKKNKDAPRKGDLPVDSSKLSQGEFIGVLKKVPGTERLFTLETETKRLVATGRGVRVGAGNSDVYRVLQLQNQLQQAQNRVNLARTPRQLAEAMNRVQNLQVQQQLAIARLQARSVTTGNSPPPGFRYETKKQNIEFQAAENVKVRTMVLPEQFDDKGNLRKPTKKELDELKGKDKNQPGYESSLEKLGVGQKVRVVLAPAPRKPAARDADDEPGDADKRMQVKLIVIQEEGTGGPAPRGKKAK
jgi:hypothetical protein